ncbi:hypothetical protein NDU88_005006 [Pleurodeles waltl]|uniref:Uncharacterized protein n=1 Tax=Pleurodeles waltl TaxID=8319 RepID=A0AAV7RIZ1_PLEWA|nr:hypothetical protein NDU88_005006 [Pleurodeles waltl]
MGTLADASDPDFRVRPRRATTDFTGGAECREEEDEEKTDDGRLITGDRAQNPKEERNIEEEKSAGAGPKDTRTNAEEPSHDPGGSWLHKVRSLIGLPRFQHKTGK